MSAKESIIRHYTVDDLASRINAAMAADGKNTPVLSVEDVAPYDEFHIGGRVATAHLLQKLGITRDMRVLDIGSGIGGAARYTADSYGCRVTGIDITPEYSAIGNMLSNRTSSRGLVTLETGNALDMPFEGKTFDRAYTIHVAMNIRERDALYKETKRVLQPGALFGIYDVMAEAENPDIEFPVPWASGPEDSFLATPEETQSCLENTGFEVLEKEDRRGFAIASLYKLKSKINTEGKAMAAAVIMGDNYEDKISNLVRNIENRQCSPWQLICRRI